MAAGLEPGLEHEVRMVVTPDNLASRYVAGTPAAFATPDLVGLIERTAAELVAPCLKEGETTVGTVISLRHLAATPVGMQVRCVARLAEVDRRRLVFKAEAWDDTDKIGEADHERFIINREGFERRLVDKAQRARP
jgi:predicted thioesterase